MSVLKRKVGETWENVIGGGSSGLPTGGTAGQVLTVADDGSIVWADPTGGSSVPSAEEVAY